MCGGLTSRCARPRCSLHSNLVPGHHRTSPPSGMQPVSMREMKKHLQVSHIVSDCSFNVQLTPRKPPAGGSAERKSLEQEEKCNLVKHFSRRQTDKCSRAAGCKSKRKHQICELDGDEEGAEVQVTPFTGL